MRMLTTALFVTLFLLTTCASADMKFRGATKNRCDVTEINHFYDEQGRHVFDQVIFFNWDSRANRYQVLDWRLVKGGRENLSDDERAARRVAQLVPPYVPRWIGSSEVPELQADGTYKAIWYDTSHLNGLRMMVSDSIRESWTQYDVELIERPFLPKEQRKELTDNTLGRKYAQKLIEEFRVKMKNEEALTEP